MSGNRTLSLGWNIEEIIKLYERHPGILKIKENVNIRDKFVFDDTTSQDINKRRS